MRPIMKNKIKEYDEKKQKTEEELLIFLKNSSQGFKDLGIELSKLYKQFKKEFPRIEK